MTLAPDRSRCRGQPGALAKACQQPPGPSLHLNCPPLHPLPEGPALSPLQDRFKHPWLLLTSLLPRQHQTPLWSLTACWSSSPPCSGLPVSSCVPFLVLPTSTPAALSDPQGEWLILNGDLYLQTCFPDGPKAPQIPHAGSPQSKSGQKHVWFGLDEVGTTMCQRFLIGHTQES